MSLNATQLRQMVIKTALENLGLWSPAAEQLVLSTVVVENVLIYRKQHGAGPALGLWQVEPATHDDLRVNCLSYRQELGAGLMELRAPALSMDEYLPINQMYGAAVCPPMLLPSARGGTRGR